MSLVNFVRKEYKWLFGSVIVFFAVHMVKFTNYFPCWDTYGGLAVGEFSGSNIGRWFFWISKVLLSSKYDLQWLEGVECAIFIGLAVILSFSMFEIRSFLGRVSLMLLIISFPSMTGTFVYGFCSSSYLLGFFLSVFAVYLSVNEEIKQGWIWSALCIAFSLGLYQIYLLSSIGIVLLICSKKIIEGGNDIKRLPFSYGKSIILGGILYKILDVFIRSLSKTELSDYQGVSKVGQMSIQNLTDGIKSALKNMLQFYFWDKKMSLYVFINLATIILVLIFLCLLLRTINISFSEKCIASGLILAALPLTYAYYLISPDISYHIVMEFGNSLIFFIPIVFDVPDKNRKIIANRKYSISCIKTLATVSVVILAFYNCVNANVVYKQMEISTERTRFETYEVLMKIDETVGLGTYPIAVYGAFNVAQGYDIEPVPSMIGIADNYHAAVQQSFIAFAKFYYARNYMGVDQNTYERIKETDEWKNMGAFPCGEYVKVIDGIIVVRLHG